MLHIFLFTPGNPLISESALCFVILCAQVMLLHYLCCESELIFMRAYKRQVNLGSQVSRPAAMEVEVVNQILCVCWKHTAERSSVSIILQQSRHSRQHKIASLCRMIINSKENQPCQQCCNLGARFYFAPRLCVQRFLLTPFADAGDEVIRTSTLCCCDSKNNADLKVAGRLIIWGNRWLHSSISLSLTV